MGTQPFLAWKGKESDERIFWCYRPNDWSNQQEVRYFATTSAPALVTIPAEGGEIIYMAWKGADTDTNIWLAMFTTAWSDQWTLGGDFRTVDRPALAVYNNQLVLAWRSADNDQHLWYATYDLVNYHWSQASWALDGQAGSTHGPALAVYRDKLFMAWKGSGEDQNLWWATYDGISWSDQQAFPGGSTHGPALAGTRNALVMAWKGSGTDDHLWCASYNGQWSPQRLAVGGSSHGPSLGVVHSQAGTEVVHMVWKGIEGDPRMWWSTGGWNWEPQQWVANGYYGTSDSPAVASVALSDL